VKIRHTICVALISAIAFATGALAHGHKPVQIQKNSRSTVVDLSHSQFNSKVAADETVVIIDVRTAAEYAEGHVPNAINIPHKTILANASLLEAYRGQDMIFYCRSGRRASWVTDYLTEENTFNGAVLYHLDGDMNAWLAADLPVEK